MHKIGFTSDRSLVLFFPRASSPRPPRFFMGSRSTGVTDARLFSASFRIHKSADGPRSRRNSPKAKLAAEMEPSEMHHPEARPLVLVHRQLPEVRTFLAQRWSRDRCPRIRCRRTDPTSSSACRFHPRNFRADDGPKNKRQTVIPRARNISTSSSPSEPSISPPCFLHIVRSSSFIRPNVIDAVARLPLLRASRGSRSLDSRGSSAPREDRSSIYVTRRVLLRKGIAVLHCERITVDKTDRREREKKRGGVYSLAE